MSRQNVEAFYPLSPAQQGMLLDSLSASEEGIYVEQVALRISGGLDPERLEKAWRKTALRHPALRTAFIWKGQPEPLQVVFKQVTVGLDRDAWHGLTPGEEQRKLANHLDEERRRGFHLGKPPLFRAALFELEDECYLLTLAYHHILMDGWSQSVLLQDWFSCYRALSRGGEGQVSEQVPGQLPAPRPYKDFVAWLRRQDESRAEAFWRRRLRGFTETTPLGSHGSSLPALSRKPAERYGAAGGRLGAAELTVLEAWARRRQVTFNALLQGLWAILLSRYSARLDIVFGATVSGRPPELRGVDSTLGLFINTLPVRLEVDPEQSVSSWIGDVHQRHLELRRYENVPGGKIRQWSEMPASRPLFETLLVFENYPAPEADSEEAEEGLSIEPIQAGGGRTRYALTLLVTAEDGLDARLVYDRERLEDAAAEHIPAHLVALLQGLAADLEQPVRDLLERLPGTEIPQLRPPRGGAGSQSEPEGDPGPKVAPRNPLEETIARIWAELFERRPIGIHDSFLDLGGSSLLAIELAERLRLVLGTALPLSVLMENPTIAGVAAHVRERRVRGEEEKLHASMPAPRIDPQRGFEPFPLTGLQEAYRLGGTGVFELAADPHAYMDLALTDLDSQRLERALGHLIERHPMLRSHIRPDGRQQVLERVPGYQIGILDLRGVSARRAETGLLKLRRGMSHRGPKSAEWPLFEVRLTRLGERRYRLHLSLSLLICDAASFTLFLAELAHLYSLPEDSLPPLELTYRDYVLTLEELGSSELAQRSKSYWQRRLATLPPAPDLPLARRPQTVDGHHLTLRHGQLEPLSWQRFQRRCQEIAVTPTAALATVYATILATWSAERRFTLNVLFSRRHLPHPQIHQVFGNLSTTLLLEVDAAPTESFRVRAERLQQQLWRDLEHCHYTGVEVLRELNRARGGRLAARMPVVYTSALDLHQEVPTAQTHPVLADPEGDLLYSAVQTPQVWIDHQVGITAGALGYNWDAVEELFPDGLVAEMFAAYGELLRRLADDEAAWQAPLSSLFAPPRFPSQPIEPLPIESQQLQTQPPEPGDRLHFRFAEQAPRRRGEPAIITGGRTLTYDELAARVADLDRRLRSHGVGPGQLVEVVMEPGWEQVVAVLGVLRRGAAYLPVDPRWPAERRAYLLRHARVEVVLTQPWLVEELMVADGIEVLTVDADQALDRATPASSESPGDDSRDSLAYVIFTSGSTGLPKGVMIDHRGALNTLADVNRRFAVGPRDRVLSLSALSFDLSVYDIFGLLAVGGAIVFPAVNQSREPGAWRELIEQHRVTVWNTVPALMKMLVDHLESRRQSLPESLRLVLLSGDWIPLDLPDRIRALSACPDLQVISLGGATEASIWSILHPVEGIDPAWTSIPYGRAMDHQTCQVLDEDLEPRPVWAVGSIHIGGIGLARGYWRDEEKTAQSFRVRARDGQRLYRTGDLGRYLPDGQIEILGREDFQVKVQGYRIELGEIEAALSRHEGLRAAVVVAAGEFRGEKRLVAYVVPDPESSPSVEELRRFLERQLPAHMVPAAFVEMGALPLSANGKIDRGALPEVSAGPAVGTGPAAGDETRTAPSDSVELELVQIWEELLESRPIGVRDDFFDLGGHSLLAVRLMGRIHRQLGCDLPLSSLVAGATIERLAATVRSAGTTARSVLVPIHSGSAKRPFFCVHPVGGSVVCYVELARRLGSDQPFHALQAPDPDGEVSLVDLAARYVRELPEVEEPYLLGGWSMGGVVAFEMARQLVAEGREVDLVALIDAAVPGGEPPDDVALAVWFARDLATLAGRESPVIAADLQRLAGEERLPYLLEQLRGAGVLSGEGDLAQVRRSYERFRVNARALAGYVPGIYSGRVALFRPSEASSPRERGGDLSEWSEFIRGDLEVHVVAGDHYTMVREPQVRTLAALLKGYLDGTEAPGRMFHSA